MSRKTSASELKNLIRRNGISILAIVIAVPALLYTLSVGTPKQYVQSAGNMLASAASMYASVPSNPDNTVAAQLAEKEAQLNQREAEIAALASARSLSLGELLGASSFFISLLLLILVALNFYYDVKRGRLVAMPKRFQVDLR